MPNVLKYTTGAAPSGSFKKGNFYIGNETSDYGATFYSGITPPPGGYTIYLNKGSGGPSIICPANDTELIYWTNVIAGSAYTTAQQCLDYFATQTDKVIVTDEYRGIVTDGLVLNLDADHVSSYPETGTTWYDLAGNNNGTLTNGPTFASGSIVFDGVDDYVSCNGTNPSLDITSEITMIAWVNPTTIGDSWQGIFLRQTVGEYELWMYGNKLRYGLKLNGSINRDSGNISLTANKWYMLAWTYDGSAVRLYVNGVADSVFSKSGTITTSDRTMYIGYSGFSSEYFNGKIASCQLYNKALTHAEILQNYQAQLPTFLQSDIVTKGLVLNLDASYTTSYPGSGTTWSDLSGNGLAGTLTNGPTYSTASNGAIVFDGVDDYVSIDNTFSLTDSQAFTFSTWIYPTTGILTNTYAVIGTIKASTTHWQLSYSSDPTYNILFAFAGTSTSVGTVSTATTLVPLNSWGLVTAWYNGGDKSDINNWKIYINGVDVTLKSTGTTGASTNATSLGYRPGTGGNSQNYFKGNIALSQIYNRALSASEILQNYHAQLNRAIVRDGLVLHLDAGNPDSYDGTGTRWFDLTGNQNFGNLTNGVGYMSASGSMTFDGVNDYVMTPSLFNPTANPNESVFIWWYPQTSGQIVTELGQAELGYWHDANIDMGSDGRFHFSIWHGTLINHVSTSAYSFNQWYHLGFTYSHGSPGTLTAYIDGVSVGTVNFTRQTTTALHFAIAAQDSTNVNKYGSEAGVTTRYAQGKCGAFLVYNRALTAAEVQQNFEVQRSRFGI